MTVKIVLIKVINSVFILIGNSDLHFVQGDGKMFRVGCEYALPNALPQKQLIYKGANATIHEVYPIVYQLSLILTTVDTKFIIDLLKMLLQSTICFFFL